jgi:hypothetical protein
MRAEIDVRDGVTRHGPTKSELRHWRLPRTALEKLRVHPELVERYAAWLDGWIAGIA